MPRGWTPRLQLSESGGRCRLSLGGYTSGQGHTLQEAADDLVARLLGLVISTRASGVQWSKEIGPPDLNWLEYISELGDLAARGGDIRERIF